MPSRAAVLDRNQLLLETAEERAAREVEAAYNSARNALIAFLLARWMGPSDLPPREAIDLVRQLGLLPSIDSQLLLLESQVGRSLRAALEAGAQLAVEQIERELALLPPSLRPTVSASSLFDTATVDLFTGVALQALHAGTQSLAASLQRELQNGLIQGQSLPDLVASLLSATPTGNAPALWVHGHLSADRQVRRTVITANNAGRLAALRAINGGGQIKLQKQAIAFIDARTTNCCLAVHGQIRDIDQPYDLTATPRFAPQMMMPAFHWLCRTSSVLYHPVFERGGLTTASMKSSASAELARRDKQITRSRSNTPTAAVKSRNQGT